MYIRLIHYFTSVRANILFCCTHSLRRQMDGGHTSLHHVERHAQKLVELVDGCLQQLHGWHRQLHPRGE